MFQISIFGVSMLPKGYILKKVVRVNWMPKQFPVRLKLIRVALYSQCKWYVALLKWVHTPFVQLHSKNLSVQFMEINCFIDKLVKKGHQQRNIHVEEICKCVRITSHLLMWKGKAKPHISKMLVLNAHWPVSAQDMELNMDKRFLAILYWISTLGLIQANLFSALCFSF